MLQVTTCAFNQVITAERGQSTRTHLLLPLRKRDFINSTGNQLGFLPPTASLADIYQNFSVNVKL